MLTDYAFVRQIGKGSYGEVWLSKHKRDRRQYVLKKISLINASQKERKAAEQECKLLSQLKHPNIVGYKDSFEMNGILYIAMAFCEGGDVYTKLKQQSGTPLIERQIVEWFVQIAMALQYMHERNILHRDLKTQNIFLTRSKIIKVGDLGIARVLDSSNDMAKTLIGTPYYMSPELFANKPYNHKSDVWALGCCVYEMATLKHAFNARDFSSLSYKILKGRMPDMPNQYSSELVGLIRSMLNLNPDKRPSVNRILRDQFIRRNIQLFLESTSRRPTTAPGSAAPASAARQRALQQQQQQRQQVPTAASVSEDRRPPPTPPGRQLEQPRVAQQRRNANSRGGIEVDSAAAAAASAPAATPVATPRLDSAARRKRREQMAKNSPAFTNSEQYCNLQSLVLEQKRRPQSAKSGNNRRQSPRPVTAESAASAPSPAAARQQQQQQRQRRDTDEEAEVVDGSGAGADSESVSGSQKLEQKQDMDDLVQKMSETLTATKQPKAAGDGGGDQKRPASGNSSSGEEEEQKGPIESREETLSRTNKMNNRLVQLSRECVQKLGVALLRQCYDVLNRDLDSDLMEEELRSLLGPERFQEFAGKIWQLKFVEEQLASGH